MTRWQYKAIAVVPVVALAVAALVTRHNAMTAPVPHWRPAVTRGEVQAVLIRAAMPEQPLDLGAASGLLTRMRNDPHFADAYYGNGTTVMENTSSPDYTWRRNELRELAITLAWEGKDAALHGNFARSRQAYHLAVDAIRMPLVAAPPRQIVTNGSGTGNFYEPGSTAGGRAFGPAATVVHDLKNDLAAIATATHGANCLRDAQDQLGRMDASAKRWTARMNPLVEAYSERTNEPFYRG